MSKGNPWPHLARLHQGDIERTALVDATGRVVARVAPPSAYDGDLRTAVEDGELTEQIVSACVAPMSGVTRARLSSGSLGALGSQRSVIGEQNSPVAQIPGRLTQFS